MNPFIVIARRRRVLKYLKSIQMFMAKHPGRTNARRFGRYIKGNIDIDAALGTLAPKTAVLVASDTVVDRTLVSSIVATYSLSGLTQAENDGPIEVGVAHSDYSLAEVEAFLELDTSWSETDLTDREIMTRKIRRIGVFDTPSQEVTAGGAYTLNDGKPIKTKLNWIVTDGQGLNFFHYNLGTSALATTDPNGNIRGHANLWPR